MPVACGIAAAAAFAAITGLLFSTNGMLIHNMTPDNEAFTRFVLGWFPSVGLARVMGAVWIFLLMISAGVSCSQAVPLPISVREGASAFAISGGILLVALMCFL